MALGLLVFIGTMRSQGNKGIGDIFLSGKLRIKKRKGNSPYADYQSAVSKKTEEERARDTHLTNLPPFFFGLELFDFELFQKQSALIPYFEQPQPPEDVPSDLSEQHPVFFP